MEKFTSVENQLLFDKIKNAVDNADLKALEYIVEKPLPVEVAEAINMHLGMELFIKEG